MICRFSAALLDAAEAGAQRVNPAAATTLPVALTAAGTTATAAVAITDCP